MIDNNNMEIIRRFREILELYPSIANLFIINSEGECIIALTNELDEKLDYSASIKIILDLADTFQFDLNESLNFLMARFAEDIMILTEENSFYICIQFTNKNLNLKSLPRIKSLFRKILKTLDVSLNDLG